MGSLCGYVGVPSGHPAYGLELDLDVHGGVTFAGEADGDKWPRGWWWFGFDCMHAGDGLPALLEKPELGFLSRHEPYRIVGYVAGECNQLASQLAAMEPDRVELPLALRRAWAWIKWSHYPIASGARYARKWAGLAAGRIRGVLGRRSGDIAPSGLEVTALMGLCLVVGFVVPVPVRWVLWIMGLRLFTSAANIFITIGALRTLGLARERLTAESAARARAERAMADLVEAMRRAQSGETTVHLYFEDGTGVQVSRLPDGADPAGPGDGQGPLH